jgi:hypothetical protein
MAPFLCSLASFTTRRFCGSPKQVFKATWLVSLALVTLSSCSRATYVFSPGLHAYLATERPAPSVSGSAAPKAATRADSLPPATSQRPPGPAASGRASKPRLLAPTPAGGHLPAAARPLATKLVAKRLAKLAAAPHKAHNAASYAGAASSSGTLVVALCLLGAGLLGLLIGASISTNVVGAIFGVFFIALGSVALVIGLILLLIALIGNE